MMLHDYQLYEYLVENSIKYDFLKYITVQKQKIHYV